MERTDDRLNKLEDEIAERRPVAELIKLLIYFIIGIAAILAFFGLQKFSDIQNIIKEEVGKQYSKDQQKYINYEALISKTKTLSTDFEELYGKYRVALNNFSNLGKVTEDFDIEGKVGQVISESTQRQQQDQKNEKSKLMYEEPWRSNAISLLELLASIQEKRNFDSDFIFNASQCADRLKLNDLALRLISAANKRRPNDAPIKAGMLSAAVNIGNEAEIEKAYSELLNMVKNLTTNSPHIVLSEAWNATEDQRRYSELTETIDGLANNANVKLIPSYAYAIQAEAILRASGENAIELANQANKKAKKALSEETSHSSWAQSSLRQIMKVDSIIKKSLAMR